MARLGAASAFRLLFLRPAIALVVVAEFPEEHRRMNANLVCVFIWSRHSAGMVHQRILRVSETPLRQRADSVA